MSNIDNDNNSTETTTIVQSSDGLVGGLPVLHDGEENAVIAAQSVNGIPDEINYGIAYTITVNPPEAEYQCNLYFEDNNANLISKAEGMVIGIPTWNSRLSSNFPEGTYRLIVKSLDGKVLVDKEYELTRPDGDAYRKVKASQ